MEAELGEFSRDNKALQLAMAQKDLRLDATTKEMLQERQKVSRLFYKTAIPFILPLPLYPPPPKIVCPLCPHNLNDNNYYYNNMSMFGLPEQDGSLLGFDIQ